MKWQDSGGLLVSQVPFLN